MEPHIIKRIKRRDKIARLGIIFGGWLILVSVIGILVIIISVAIPLFYSPSLELTEKSSIQALSTSILGIQTDEQFQKGFMISQEGQIAVLDLGKNLSKERILQTFPVLPPSGKQENLTVRQIELTHQFLMILWSNGMSTFEQIQWQSPSVEHPENFLQLKRITQLAEEKNTEPSQITHISMRLDKENQASRAVALIDRRILITQQFAIKNVFGKMTQKLVSWVIQADIPGEITAIALDEAGKTLYAGTSEGTVLRWNLKKSKEPELTDRLKYSEGKITSLGFIFGDVSLIVGDSLGSLSACFTILTELEEKKENPHKTLEKIHVFSSQKGEIQKILPFFQEKSFLSLTEKQTLSVHHLTTEKQYFEFTVPEKIQHVVVAPRGNGILLLDQQSNLQLWSLENPHPEASMTTLFGKVWYENYPKPAYVWQSSSGNDDFEPKLSLVPLIFGSIKGTFYAMIFAAPLALLAAIYTSQFLHPNLKKFIKPTIELMASIPSVILGFLTALWLAPMVEKRLVAFFLGFIFVPLCAFLFILSWPIFSKKFPRLSKVGQGYEFFFVLPGILLGILLSLVLSPWIESLFFQGDFKIWMFQNLGILYDQRNCVIIAFGLGFAVIPLIFTIAEDAISNVPKSLSAASLALGASRWQTLWRVILPTAASGIFAGLIIGFGRAIGETMIVLMATGNTPILDWSPFNGMRTLSANIAVEIPEAPVNGTLYRILFLSAVLLFLLTFILNTLAEIVRYRLRKKYGRI
ncbi:MAG: ABC transporter permease subunit [Planctomycetota bacterium]